MEISKTNVGASAYAMKKSLTIPGITLKLLQNTQVFQNQSTVSDSPAVPDKTSSASSVKGATVDVVV